MKGGGDADPGPATHTGLCQRPSILLLYLDFLLYLSELLLYNPLAAVVLLEEAEVGHLQLPPAELENLHGTVIGHVQWCILANMVLVLVIVDLEIMRKSHKVQQLADVEEPVLFRMDSRYHNLVMTVVKWSPMNLRESSQ